MKKTVEHYNPHSKSLFLLSKANEIIEEYQKQGFDLTLRQLYYQFVSRDLIPNDNRSYKNLGKVISKGRRGGFIDWDAITDRTRFLRDWNSFENSDDFMSSVIDDFNLDIWKNQDLKVEVFFEKDALLGILQRACSKYRNPFFSCRGYVSDSEMYEAAQRIKRSNFTVILHFGDHDPSGIDMTRDIKDRLALFGANNFDVNRMALNYDQIEALKPPPNPAKESDSRFLQYKLKYGDYSWELDALDPNYLVKLVHDATESYINKDVYHENLLEEIREREKLQKYSHD